MERLERGDLPRQVRRSKGRGTRRNGVNGLAALWLLAMLTPLSAQAEICYEPQVIGEPTELSATEAGEQGQGNGNGQGNGQDQPATGDGSVQPAHYCPPGPTLPPPPPPLRDADYVSQAVPTVMAVGRSYSARVSMKNTGSATWTAADGYRLGSQNPGDNTVWGLGRDAVTGSIATASTEHFYFTVKAPTTAGVYDFQWRMVDEGQAWFGSYSPNVRVTVVSGSLGATPNPCIISSGIACASSITWHSSAANAEVWISERDGSGMRLFAQGQSGTQSADWIPLAGKRFYLKSSGVTIDTLDVYANARPSVSLTAPAAGAVSAMPGRFTLAASASDADGIRHVQFRVDGTLVNTDTTAPYAYTWTTSAAGEYTMQALAMDNAGQARYSNAATVKVVSGSLSAAPNPCITSGSTCSSSITWTSSAADAELWVSNRDGSGMQQLASAQNGTRSVSGITLAGKRFHLKSSGVSIDTLDVHANALPSVSLTAPADGTIAPWPGRFTLEAGASDADGIRHVQFKVDGAPVNTDTTAPYAYAWTASAEGEHTVQAVAVDNTGAARSSNVATVTVKPQPVVKGDINGVYRNSSGYYVSGWACATTLDQSLQVHLYAGGSAGSGVKVGSYTANLTSEPAVASACQASGSQYRFQIDLEGARWNHGGQAIYIHGISPVGGANNLLSRSGQFRIPSPGDGVSSLTRSYVYDEHHRLCKTIEPESAATIIEYDPAGNVLWTASGQPFLSTFDCERGSVPVTERVVRHYDSRSRVLAVDYPDDRGDLTYTYTKDGLIDTLAAFDGTRTVTTSYHYNRRRLLEDERLQWGAINWSIDYHYNAYGHLAAQAWHGLTIDYAPNALGQPTRAGSFATGVSYWPNGAIRQFTYGNGIVHTLTQNARGLPERSRDAYGSAVFHDDSYDYDYNGNVAAISDGLAEHVGDRTMTYDGLDRLTRVVSPMFGGDHTAVFAYDGVDNLLFARVGDKRKVSYHYDGNNRLTNVRNAAGATVVGLGYTDERGNVTNKNGQVFDFDYGNRLRSINGVTAYVYDGLGRRVRDTTTIGDKYSQYSRAGQLAMTSDERAGTISEYVYLGSSLVAIRERDAATSVYTVKYQHTDALGSPVAVTSASRVELERDRYAPYGTQIGGAANDGPGYTGHVMDAATGLTYMQQRYYDPMLGIFLSVDPITALSNPLTLFNRYRYANSNPYTFTDPDGRCGTRIKGHSAPGCGSFVLNGASTSLRSPMDTGRTKQSSSSSEQTSGNGGAVRSAVKAGLNRTKLEASAAAALGIGVNGTASKGLGEQPDTLAGEPVVGVGLIAGASAKFRVFNFGPQPEGSGGSLAFDPSSYLKVKLGAALMLGGSVEINHVGGGSVYFNIGAGLGGEVLVKPPIVPSFHYEIPGSN